MSTAAILVNYNGYAVTRRAIERLCALPDRPDWVVVVDNGSRQDEAAAFERLGLEGLVAVRSERNEGFAGGCNAGIRWALARGCAALLLVNNDAVVQPGCVERLRRALEEGAAVACPLIVDMERPELVWSAGGECRPESGQTFNRLKWRRRDAARAPAEVSFAPGCALLVRADVFEAVGLMPERWFLYFEDAEFSLRVTRRGLRIVYVPEAVVEHAGGFSTRRGDVSYFFYWRNALLFVAEYARGRRRVARIARLLATLGLAAAFNALRGRGRRVRLLLLAARAGLLGDWSTPPALLRLLFAEEVA